MVDREAPACGEQGEMEGENIAAFGGGGRREKGGWRTREGKELSPSFGPLE
jgi:hypothetical protein